MPEIIVVCCNCNELFACDKMADIDNNGWELLCDEPRGHHDDTSIDEFVGRCKSCAGKPREIKTGYIILSTVAHAKCGMCGYEEDFTGATQINVIHTMQKLGWMHPELDHDNMYNAPNKNKCICPQCLVELVDETLPDRTL